MRNSAKCPNNQRRFYQDVSVPYRLSSTRMRSFPSPPIRPVIQSILSDCVPSARNFGDISTPLSNRKSIPGIGFISEVGAGVPGTTQPPGPPGGGAIPAPWAHGPGRHGNHNGNSGRGEGCGVGSVTSSSAPPFLHVSYCFPVGPISLLSLSDAP